MTLPQSRAKPPSRRQETETWANTQHATQPNPTQQLRSAPHDDQMSGPHQFPNVRDKLSAPSKKSAFEKARLEAEEKRKREEAETAAVYKDFVASFDQGPSDRHGSSHASSRSGGGSSGGGGSGGGGFGRSGFRGPAPPTGPGRRHFSGQSAAPPPVRPPPRKRNLGDAFDRDEEEGGVFGAAATAAAAASTGGGGGAPPSDREKRRMKDGHSGLLAFENSGGPKRRYNAAAAPADDDDDSGLRCALWFRHGGIFCFF